MKKRNSDITFEEPNYDPNLKYNINDYLIQYIFINNNDYLLNVNIFFNYSNNKNVEAYLSEDAQYLCYMIDNKEIRIKMEDYIKFINNLDKN